MKLKMLRSHYVKKNNVWVPKRAFNSKTQIRKELGFSRDTYEVYNCMVCNNLHVATRRLRTKVK